MLQQRITRMWAFTAALAVSLATAPAAIADVGQWNERTILKFSEPVMVPGATLQPGTYVFRLADSGSDRHIVRIMTEDGSRTIATTVTVAAKRQDATGDTVLRMNPTETGTPAIKAWFYPGSLYGHEFVYPDGEARGIAERTKTVVLSRDTSGDMEQGTIYVYDASAERKPWQADATINEEWNRWREQQVAGRATVKTPAGDPSKAAAPMYSADQKGLKVPLDTLEEDASKYIGKTVSVDAAVENVIGPRLFTIDEPNWGDLDGEVLVYMPTDLLALVREGDRVTVTGVPRAYVKADIEDEWGWLDLEDDIEVEMTEKPVLMANRIVGGDSNRAMVIRAPRAGESAGTGVAGTTGTATASEAAISSLGQIAGANDAITGRSVKLRNLNVTGISQEDGFWIRTASGRSVFVLPAQGDLTLSKGQRISSLEGVILQLPDGMKDRLDASGEWNDDIYIYATTVSK